MNEIETQKHKILSYLLLLVLHIFMFKN